MKVTVATRQREGSRLVTAGAPEHGYRTDVFARQLASADAVVDKIIAANQ
jgi:membrane fusion protein (multidrug efflux system)